ncbi:cytosine permease [Streptomyces roseochromogenus]|uniref:Uncharacterized protein n=1 Tax=Streptomyces roseochromogenus subsp. oscitans DS 12.976 TaxID=1352936 RepID=V6JLH3_STRRC|nr:hypothetical protein M878_38930 [Streptomyces roseochromogenus subsp. oscitans DS 12.976]
MRDPATAPARAAAGWTVFGGFLAGILVCGTGALAATAVDMNDPEFALQPLLPGWFRPLFLLAPVLGTVALNALTAYSAGLARQAIGLRIRRSRSVLVDGTVSVTPTLYALLVSNFFDTVGTVPQLTVVLLGPSTAVHATGILLRRNRYDGVALGDESRTGPFWYTCGFNLAGVPALGAGAAASALRVDTVCSGPVAAALGGVDLALPAGLLASSAAYALLMRRVGATV